MSSVCCFIRVLYRTYRLVCIRSTTPEELYSRKVSLIAFSVLDLILGKSTKVNI